MPTSILVVDPNPTRRRMYHDALRSRFNAYGVAHTHDVPMGETFDVFWISLRQAEGHGLELARDLKARNSSSLVVVYGKPDGRAVPGRGRVERSWQIDVFVPYVPDGADINATVDKALKQPRLGAALTEVLDDPFSHTGPTARSASQRPASVPPPERTIHSPSWGELIRSPLNTETLRQIMKKDLFGG